MDVAYSPAGYSCLDLAIFLFPTIKKMHPLHNTESQEFKRSFNSLIFCKTKETGGKVQVDQCKSSPLRDGGSVKRWVAKLRIGGGSIIRLSREADIRMQKRWLSLRVGLLCRAIDGLVI